MTDVMLDLETMGKNENKVICQIGACYFDNITGEIGETFKVNIDMRSHEKLGAKVDADTVYWWLAQSDEARKSIIMEPLIDATVAFNQFNDFASKAKRIWSHATFDFVTITHAFSGAGIKPSFRYSAGLDLRTLVHLAGSTVGKISREGTHHDALDDALHQVKYCVQALNRVKTEKKVVTFLKGMLNE